MSSSAIGHWTSDGTNAWRVSGNVGIGTSSPFATLSVVGNGYFSGAIAATGVTATNATTTNFVTTNATSANLTVSGTASTSALIASNSFTLGSLTGFLKATAGAVATSLINLASDVTGILPVANGGTGWSNLAAGAIPYGNGASAVATTTAGTAGYVLAYLNGVPTWAATTTLGNISGTLSVGQGGTGSTTLSGLLVGNGTSALNTASISAPLLISGSTLSIAKANGSTNGYLASSDWTNFNGKLGSTTISSLSADYDPVWNGSNFANGAIYDTGTAIGIGTTSPSALFTINSTSTTGTVFRMSNTSTGGHVYDFLETGSGNTGGAGRLDFFDKTAGTARLSIAANGNIGIGTTSPATTLSVLGNAYITGGLGIGVLDTAAGTINGWFPRWGILPSNGGTPTSAGGSYVVGDSITLNAGCTTNPVVGVNSVSGGAITAYDVQFVGNCTSIAPNPIGQLSTSGSGSGATFTLNWGPVAAALDEPSLANGNANLFIGGNLNSGSLNPGEVAGMEDYGSENTFVGDRSGGRATSGSNNTAFGDNSFGVGSGVAVTGSADTAIGNDAMRDSTSTANSVALGANAMHDGSFQTSVAIGANALYDFGGAGVSAADLVAIGDTAMATSSIMGSAIADIAIGRSAFTNVTSGSNNIAVGKNTLLNATSTNNNIAIGSFALQSSGTVSSTGNNIAIGGSVMIVNSSGSNNVAVGINSMQSNTTGGGNTAVGLSTLNQITTGNNNVAVGESADDFNQTGADNTALGVNADGTGSGSAASHSNNTAIGFQAGYDTSTGGKNIFLGAQSASTTQTGSNNIALGYDVALPSTNGSNQLDIGNLIFGTGINGEGTNLSTGNIGIGTTTPWGRLSVVGPDTSSGTLGFVVANSNNNPLFEIYDNGSASTSALYVSGDGNGSIQCAQILSTGQITGTGSVCGGTGSAPGGSNGQLEFNNSGAFGGSSNLLWNNSTNELGVNNSSPAYALDVVGFINTDQASGYKQAGQTILTASSTSGLTLGGIGAGTGLLATTTATAGDTVFGYQALNVATSSNAITAFGYEALENLDDFVASQDTAVGYQSLWKATTAKNNTAIGYKALTLNTTGTNNTAVGTQALLDNTTGAGDAALGLSALSNNTTGTNNTGIGVLALFGNQTGSNNTAVGLNAGEGVGSNSFANNSLFGANAGFALTTGGNNILIGYNSASSTQTGSNNIALGYNIDLPSTNGSNQLDIGNLIYGTGLNGSLKTVSTGAVGIGTTTPYSALDVWGPDTSANTSAFVISNSASTTELNVLDNGNATLAGTLTQNSDQRLKTNIQSLNASSSLAAINALNPVTFNWIDPDKGTTLQLGFIAQQVLPIFPSLVSTTSADSAHTKRYPRPQLHRPHLSDCFRHPGTSIKNCHRSTNDGRRRLLQAFVSQSDHSQPTNSASAQPASRPRNSKPWSPLPMRLATQRQFSDDAIERQRNDTDTPPVHPDQRRQPRHHPSRRHLHRSRRHHHRPAARPQPRHQDLSQRHAHQQHRHRHQPSRNRHHRLRRHRPNRPHRNQHQNRHHRSKSLNHPNQCAPLQPPRLPLRRSFICSRGDKRPADTEANVDAPEDSGVPVAKGRADVIWIVAPGAAALGTAAIIRTCRCPIRSVPGASPSPAGYQLRSWDDSSPPPTPRHCRPCRRDQTYWRRMSRPARLAVIPLAAAAVAIGIVLADVVTPRIGRLRPGTRRIFVFGLGQQPIGLASHLGEPCHIALGVLPGHVDHRLPSASPARIADYFRCNLRSGRRRPIRRMSARTWIPQRAWRW